MKPSPAALARFGKATGITVLLGACMAFLPLSPVVIMPFLVLPVAHLLARWGLLYAVSLIVVTGAVVFLLADVGLASLVFLALVSLGLALGLGIRRRWSFMKTLSSAAVSVVGAFVVWGLTLWLALGIDMSTMRTAVNESIDNAATLYTQMGVSQASTDLVSSQLRQFFNVLPYLIPGFAVVGALLLTGCAILLAKVIFPRLREGVDVGFSLTGFRLHWVVAYASIIGLALLVFSRGARGWEDGVLYAGINILLVSQTLFFFQGLAVLHWYGKTRQVGSGARAALYIAAVLAQALLQLTGLLGLFDTWLDCRRRFALDKPGVGPAR